ncbi:MAG: two pore domain potassium channel family protein [Chlorobi bacterium]|nr:two pore domain potassium channel family protein [Chlorobiota bacterium]
MFFIYVTYSMVRYISQSEFVNEIILLNAINSYLLIGIVGAFLFISVDVGYSYFANAEHALNFNAIVEPSFQDYVYFSFITLTTLGYGDITPIIPVAKSLTIALSLTGQLYLTILVAMLVGKYLSQTNK